MNLKFFKNSIDNSSKRQAGGSRQGIGGLDGKLRLFQRRMSEWKALYGPEKEVMFRQERIVDQMGLSDFTKLKEATITIQGKSFTHLLYHFRLAFSGW